jgi:hypothetical protein
LARKVYIEVEIWVFMNKRKKYWLGGAVALAAWIGTCVYEHRWEARQPLERFNGVTVESIDSMYTHMRADLGGDMYNGEKLKINGDSREFYFAPRDLGKCVGELGDELTPEIRKSINEKKVRYVGGNWWEFRFNPGDVVDITAQKAFWGDGFRGRGIEAHKN